MSLLDTNMGWECPKCHRCYSPSVTMCLVCPGTLPTITVDGTGGSKWIPIPWQPSTQPYRWQIDWNRVDCSGPVTVIN